MNVFNLEASFGLDISGFEHNLQEARNLLQTGLGNIPQPVITPPEIPEIPMITAPEVEQPVIPDPDAPNMPEVEPFDFPTPIIPEPSDEPIQSFWQKVKNAFNNVTDIVKSVPSKFTEMGKNILNGIKSVPDNIIGAFKNIGSGILDKIKSIPGNIADLIKSIPSKIGAGITAIKDKIVDGFKSAVEKAKDTLSQLPGKVAEIASTITKVMTAAVGAASAAAVAFAKSSIDVGKEFDASMSQVAATMGVSVDEIQNLRDFAQEMGATTAFSATQSAQALNYMALAGYDAETSMKMLPNVLNLAAAGGMELSLASDMITDSQSALGLSLDETAELVDKMAQAASKSNTSVSQLGDAILTVGGTAKNLKGGTTELATVLGILADNGIKGSEGGTALRNMLNSLTAPTDKASEMLTEMGVSVFDANGEMRSLNDVFLDLRDSMGGMTQQERMNVISTLFNARDMKSAEALLANVGERYDELSGYIDAAWYSVDGLNNALDNMKSGLNIDSIKKSMESLGVSTEEFDEAFNAAKGDAQAFAKNLLNSADAGTKYRDVIKSLGMSVDDLQGAFDAATGAAGAMADTQLDNLAGSMTYFQSALEGAKIALSDKLTPTLKTFVDFGTEGLSAVTEALKEGDIEGVFSALQPIIDKALEYILEMLPQVISIGASIVSMLAQGIASNLPIFVNTALDLVLSLADGITQNVGKATKSIATVVQKIAEWIKQNGKTLIKSGMQMIQAISQGISDNLPLIIGSVVEIISFIGMEILKNLPLLIESALLIVMSLAQYLTDNLPVMIPQIVSVILQIVDTLTNPDTLSLLIDAAIAIIIALADGLIESLPELLDKAPEIIGNLVDALVENLPKLLDAAIELIATIADGILTNLPQIFEAGKKIIIRLVRGIKSVISTVGDTIKGLWEEIKNTISERLSEAWEWGKDLISNFLEGAKEKFLDSDWSNFWEGVGESIYDFLHHSTPEKGPLKDDDEWGGDFMDNFINGIKSKQKALERAVYDTADILSEAEADELSASMRISSVSDIPEAYSAVYGGRGSQMGDTQVTIPEINFNISGGMNGNSEYELRNLAKKLVVYIDEELALRQRREIRAVGGWA